MESQVIVGNILMWGTFIVVVPCGGLLWWKKRKGWSILVAIVAVVIYSLGRVLVNA